MKPQYVQFERFPPLNSAADRRLIVHAPGMLMHGTEALLPVNGSSTDQRGVLGVLRQHGQVLTVIYPNNQFAAGEVVRRLVAQLLQEDRGVDEIILLGSSMGGMVLAEAAAELPAELRRKVRLVLVDSPFGVGSLRLSAAAAATGLQYAKLGSIRLWRWLPVVGRVPRPVEVQPDLDASEIARETRERLSGMKVSLLFLQLMYMKTWRLPADARGGYKRVEYVQCSDPRSIVRQPAAATAWIQHLTDPVHVTKLAVPHCGYLQQPGAFIAVFDRLLA